MTAIRRIAKDPALAIYYAQKALRSVPVRSAIGSTLAALVGRKGAYSAPTEVGKRFAQALTSSGIALLREKALSPASVASAREQLTNYPLLDYYQSERKHDLQTIPRDVLKARHDPQDVLRCKPLMDLANDADILSAVTEYLGATPTISLAEAWWTFGDHNSAGKSAFDDIYHRDVEDLRFVKLFLYLTDTDVDSGAHRFVLGSHADKLFTRRGPISDEEVERAYPKDKLHTVMGGAGTCFLEDTWGIHRALLATRGRRLVFQVQYSLSIKPPFGPGKPMQPLPAGYDPYINRRLYVS